MKLNPNRGNGGHITAYKLVIGSKEARDCGFLYEDGTSREIRKIIDIEHKRIIIELAEEDKKPDQ